MGQEFGQDLAMLLGRQGTRRHLLGAGVQLFASGLEQRLSLQAHRLFPSGVAQLHYRVLRDSAD